MRVAKFETLAGNEIYGDEIVESINNGPLKNRYRSPVFVSDMDGTMFHEDLGVAIFGYKLRDPKFWKMTPEKFRQVLCTEALEQVIDYMKDCDMEHEAIQMLEALIEDCVTLYTAIRARYKGKSEIPSKNDELIDTFCHRMMIIDQLVLDLEKVSQNVLNGQLIMRIRFFVGKNIKDVIRISKIVLQKGWYNTEPTYSTVNGSDLDNSDIDLIWRSSDLPPARIPDTVTKVEAVRSLFRRFIGECSMHGTIITTNLKQIANVVADYHGSPYFDDFQRQLKRNNGRNGNSLPSVIGTNLEQVPRGYFTGNVQGLPIMAEQKLNEARSLERRDGLVVSALGDSTNDWLMMRHALKNGGFAFLVGDDQESITRTFHERIKTDISGSTGEHLGSEALRRIVMVER